MTSLIMSRKAKILLSLIGLDQHDYGIKLVANALIKAGFEVIYLGKFQTAETIINSAIQEDVDIIGISINSPECIYHVEKLLSQIKEKKLGIKIVVGGSIITPDLAIYFKNLGVSEVFGPHSTIKDIINYFENQYKTL